MAKHVFIAFAVEDRNYRDLLRGQALNTMSPFEYVDESVKEPFSSAWKTQVRERIRGCDGAIALLSRNSLSAAGEKWEIQCATDEGVTLVGMYIRQSDHNYPSEMAGIRKIDWDWGEIAKFIDSL